jgi:thiosulfate/3-mercaptopyruvate sulfurtransferase
MDMLVTTEWTQEQLGAPDLAIVDCSAFMPNSGREAGAEFRQAHIPGARLLDINEVRDTSDPAPHMLPSAESFGRDMEMLGIGREERIVVYDNSPLRTAARGWFMLRHFGGSQVAILDGGFQKWLAEHRPVEAGDARPRSARFHAVECPGEVVAQADVLGSGVIVDARGKARFEGREGDPRPGVAAGHIPGSRNLPYAVLYRENGTFKAPDEIRSAFAAAGVDPAMPFTATCGSGVTANSLIFAAHLLGSDRARLYDGSWSEWGADPATPKAMGPA